MAGLRRRGNLARTIYNRMLVDEQHKHDPHSYVSKTLIKKNLFLKQMSLIVAFDRLRYHGMQVFFVDTFLQPGLTVCNTNTWYMHLKQAVYACLSLLGVPTGWCMI